MTVFMQEADIGHMTAVGTILMTGSLCTHKHTQNKTSEGFQFYFSV